MNGTKTTELRVFISSTFRDLQEEREHLVKKIFPEIRALCRERGITFTEVDLRWGLTEEDQVLGQIIRTCLEEIDRCRPYFIGITGERYGYIPALHEIHKDPELLRLYPWIEDAAMEESSIIEMEFRYGALDAPALANAARFYLRRQRRGFDEAVPEEDRERLDRLKERVRQSGLPVEEYRDPVSLGEMIYDDLLEIIDRDFADVRPPTPLELERARHEAFAASRRHAYIPSASYVKRLNEFADFGFPIATPPRPDHHFRLEEDGMATDAPIENPKSPIENPADVPIENPKSKIQNCLVAYAESGSGKSSLLAYWCQQYRRRNPEAHVIEHYVGIGAGRTDHLEIIRHVMMEIAARHRLERELPNTAVSIEREFPSWLGEARDELLVVVIDGINQLKGRALSLHWLPKQMPLKVRLIVSSTVEQTLVVVRERGWQQMGMQPLTELEREAVVVRFLSEYRKALPVDLVKRIAGDVKCAQPLFLRTLLEELRLFGQHEKLEKEVGSYLETTGTEDLFQRVLERLEEDFSTKAVREMMSLLWASRQGLSESELADLTGTSRLKLSTLVIALDYHLLRTEGLLSFFHDYLRRAVEKRYLADDSRKRDTHLRLATYYQGKQMDARIATELPWQLLEGGDRAGLKEVLSRIDLLSEYGDDSNRYELYDYWMSVGGVQEMERVYSRQLALRQESDIRGEAEESLLLSACHLYALSGIARAAVPLAQRALELCRERVGTDDLEVAKRMTVLGRVLQHSGRAAESEPLMQRVLEIHERALGESHPEVGTTLNNLAVTFMFLGRPAEALPLLRRGLQIREALLGRDHPDLATLLINFASALSNTGNYGEAEQHIRRSLGIIEQVYGPDHLRMGGGLIQLAYVSQRLGRYSEAERLNRQALALAEVNVGKEHPQVAQILINLASVLNQMKDYTGSQLMLHRSLAILESSVGHEHPTVAVARLHLGIALTRTGKAEEGERMLTAALEAMEKSLGREHRDTIAAVQALADSLLGQNKLSIAEELLTRVHDFHQQHTGLPRDLSKALFAMGKLYRQRGETDKAIAYMYQALSLLEQALGPDHPETIEARQQCLEDEAPLPSRADEQ